MRYTYPESLLFAYLGANERQILMEIVATNTRHNDRLERCKNMGRFSPTFFLYVSELFNF